MKSTILLMILAVVMGVDKCPGGQDGDYRAVTITNSYQSGVIMNGTIFYTAEQGGLGALPYVLVDYKSSVTVCIFKLERFTKITAAAARLQTNPSLVSCSPKKDRFDSNQISILKRSSTLTDPQVKRAFVSINIADPDPCLVQ